MAVRMKDCLHAQSASHLQNAQPVPRYYYCCVHHYAPVIRKPPLCSPFCAQGAQGPRFTGLQHALVTPKWDAGSVGDPIPAAPEGEWEARQVARDGWLLSLVGTDAGELRRPEHFQAMADAAILRSSQSCDAALQGARETGVEQGRDTSGEMFE